MADIQVSDITSGDIINNTWVGTGVFDVLMDAVNKNIDVQYQSNRITGKNYADVYLGSLQAVLAQSVQYVLQEKITEAQIDTLVADNLLKTKQLEISEQELELKTTEVNRLRDTTEAELEKQWGYDVTRDLNDELVLGASTAEGKIDKDILATEAQVANLAADNLLKTKQLEISEQELSLKTTEANRLRDTTEAELEKQWGYDVTRSTDGELLLGSSTGDGNIDREIAVKEEQEKDIYTSRILKDKQAANLGLDLVVKTANTNPETVYTPKYEE